MKHSPLEYAKAFRAALAGHPREGEKFVKNFVKLILKNGDAHQGPKILAATERLLRTVTGTKSVTLVTARASRSLRTAFHRLIHSHDIVRETIDPSLIAGAKVLINDELQFDGSLKRKIEKLFYQQ